MMLFKLSLANIKKSFKDYAIYFFTLILGVSIFYVFNSIDSQTSMLKISNSTHELIDMIISLMNIVSVFVSMVLGFLIIYASRFLIKKRKKEFGIYMILGMSKQKVSLLLLVETIVIGILSLFVGLGAGVVISQVTSIFIANMFEADMSAYAFNFSFSAFIKTIIYFSIIYLVVMIFNTFNISKLKLIDLLQSSKRNESIKLKNPTVSIGVFIFSIVDLGIAYYLVTAGFMTLMKYPGNVLFIPIIMGIVGTFTFFWSISGFLLKIMMKSKYYVKGLNRFIFRQVNSKINTTIVSMSMICLLLFVTICTFSSGFAIRTYYNGRINDLAPADFELGFFDKNVDVNKVLYEDVGVKKEDLKDVTRFKMYYYDDFTYGDSLGSYAQEVSKQNPNLFMKSSVDVMKVSEYNALAKLYNNEEIILKENQYAIVSNAQKEIYDGFLQRQESVTIAGTKYTPAYTKTVDGFAEMFGQPVNLGFFIVPDSLDTKHAWYKDYVVGNYNTEDKEAREALDNKFFYEANYQQSTSFTGRTPIKEESIGVGAMATFIGLFIGITFMIASGALLALKELSDCLDDKEKYSILRKIGTDEKMVYGAIFKQTLIFFALPLIVAIIHSVFGIMFCMNVLSVIGINNMIGSILITAAFIIVIYGGYFYLTYLSNRSVLKDIR